MYSFPKLEGFIDAEDYHVTKKFDPTKRSPFASGYQVKKTTATFVPLLWKFKCRCLTDTDVENLQTFEKNVKDGESTFQWLNTKDKETYYVCFDEECLPLDFRLESDSSKLWLVDIALLQTQN